MSSRVLCAVSLAVHCLLAYASPIEKRAAVSNSDYSLTFIYQNNLNASDDINHAGAIVLSPMRRSTASAACAAINENLLSEKTIQNYATDFSEALAYLAFSGRTSADQAYIIENGVVVATENAQLSFEASSADNSTLPVLCTQSSNESQPANSTGAAFNELNVAAAGNVYTGYRNQKSFRFLGIPYADQPARFTYSHLNTKTGQTINATAYGSECAQVGGGSEDCLFLNIQTPYIPQADKATNLRPVMFWIHGGGFTGGTGADPLSDGGNLASREDIVVVTINYRLSTLGFLAIPGTNITGNFGIGDQITALEWTVANIANFGGDPTQITIIGESAGAGSVRTLLGSPPAIGKFQGAIAMSNLGGGVDLGLTSNYGTTYSSYYTISESYALAGLQIFNETNCTSSSLQAEITCLTAFNASELVALTTVARYVVQDGTIVNTAELDVVKRNGSSAYVPIIFGIAANDGASFSIYPTTPVLNETAGLMIGLGINESYANAIINSGLFPYYSTGNLTLDAFNVTQRVATDNTFRCIDEATVYAGAVTGTFPATYYYQIDRTITGYNPNNLPETGPTVNPEVPSSYFQLHGADMPFMLATLTDPRDANDIYTEQLVSGYFAEFVRSGQPNPSVEYLSVRGYTQVLEAVQETGPWDKVSSASGPTKYLDYPAVSGTFNEMEQCTWLNYSIGYYLDQ